MAPLRTIGLPCPGQARLEDRPLWAEIGEREASVRSGMNRVDWMTEHADSVRSIVDSGRFPYFNRIVKDAATPHREAIEEAGFREGLECLLDGFAGRLARGHQ